MTEEKLLELEQLIVNVRFTNLSEAGTGPWELRVAVESLVKEVRFLNGLLADAGEDCKAVKRVEQSEREVSRLKEFLQGVIVNLDRQAPSLRVPVVHRLCELALEGKEFKPPWLIGEV